MSQFGNIFLIGESEKKLENIKQKISLLRKNDTFSIFTFEYAKKGLQKKTPKLVIILSDKKEILTLDLIKYIKNFKKSQDIPVLLASSNFSDEFVLDANEAGAFDFIHLATSDIQFALKIISILKIFDKQNKNQLNLEILSHLKLYDKVSELYDEKISNFLLFETLKSIDKDEKLTLMAISPDIKYKNILTQTLLAKTIRNSIRKEDFILNRGNVIYILLQGISQPEAGFIFDKIKQNLGSLYTVSAAVFEIENFDFKSAIKCLDLILEKSLEIGDSILFFSDVKNQFEEQYDILVQNKKQNLKTVYKMVMKVFEKTKKLCKQKFPEICVFFEAQDLSFFLNFNLDNLNCEFKIDIVQNNISMTYRIKGEDFEFQNQNMVQIEQFNEKILKKNINLVLKKFLSCL